jgi:integrase
VIAALVKGGHIQSAAPTVAALLGGETVVTIRISALFDEYKLIAGDKVTGKSKLQMDKWSDVRRRAAERFCEVVGDKDLATVTKEDGRKFRDHWDRLVADKGLSHDTARLEMVKVQAMIKELGNRRGWELCGNLFEGLMPERREGDTKAIPFSVAWLTDKILPALATYENTEARNATYLAIETGMSPSEICNLDASMIKLDGPVPHIDLRNGAGTLKTANRRRVIPLVGVALEAMKQQRNGFAYGRDGAAKLSNEVSAFFDAKGLREHADNTALYSIRHSFKDRMRDAGIDHEMRNMLMGHSNKEERYGNGFVLAKKRDALAAMALPAHIG